MKAKISNIAVVLMTGLSVCSFSANAATDWTWTLNNNTPIGSNLPGATTATGYAAVNNTTVLTSTVPSGLPDLTWYSGLGDGICSPTPADPNCTSPNHAMDNVSGYESIVLGFGNAVTLGSLDIGWSSNGKYNTSGSLITGTPVDMSVLAYTGSGTPISAGTGGTSTYNNLLSNGWVLVGQYSGVTTSTSTTTGAWSINSLGTSVSSSYWMVAAYNSTFGSCTSCTANNDYMKLFAVAGNTYSPPPPGKVPAPASLLLLGTALLGMAGLRRREKGIAA